MEYKSEAHTIAQGLCEAAAMGPDAFLEQGEQIIRLARTMAREQLKSKDLISSWWQLKDHLTMQTLNKGREEFRVLFLDKRNRLIEDVLMNEGTVDHAPVYPREVIRKALELDASSIILTHNHPSGDPTPSAPDIDMTRQVIEACRVMRITVHDHVITGKVGDIVSFKALGLI